MNKGWVRLHRKISENIFLMKDDNAYLVFTKLLIYVDSNGRWAGGKYQIAEIMNMKPGTVYEVLRRLQANQLITISPTKKYSVYTICNWQKYQSSPNRPNEMFPTTAQPQPNHEPTMAQHSNKNKEVRIKNKAPSKIDEELAAKELAAKQPRPTAGRKSLKEMYAETVARKRKEATA